MGGLSGDELLGLPVCMHGIELARPVDVLLDAEARRLVGIEVVCGDKAHRFLPLGAATLRKEEIAIDSALALLDDGAYYLDRGRKLSVLRGTPVVRVGEVQGALADVVLDLDGALVKVVLGDGRTVAAADASVGAGSVTRSAA